MKLYSEDLAQRLSYFAVFKYSLSAKLGYLKWKISREDVFVAAKFKSVYGTGEGQKWCLPVGLFLLPRASQQWICVVFRVSLKYVLRVELIDGFRGKENHP